MKQKIILHPVEHTAALMIELEQKGLIIRLSPGSHHVGAAPGQTLCRTLYQTDPIHGSHKLMFIEVNRTTLPEFGTHPENEDFYMIGSPDSKPLYLVIALCDRFQLDAKIKNGTVTNADFVTLKVKYNNPELSFFIMVKDIPHGEAVGHSDGGPGTFYVTESTDLPDVDTDMGAYELFIQE